MRAALEVALRTFVAFLSTRTPPAAVARGALVAAALAGTGVVNLGVRQLLESLDPKPAARPADVARGAQETTLGAVSGPALTFCSRELALRELAPSPRPEPRIVASPAAPLAQADPAFVPARPIRSARRPWEYEDEPAPTKPLAAIAGSTAQDEPFVSAAPPALPVKIGADARVERGVEGGE